MMSGVQTTRQRMVLPRPLTAFNVITWYSHRSYQVAAPNQHLAKERENRPA
jgi:hypothetical protein